MNKDNTYGNKFWTPEQQRQMEILIQQQQQMEQAEELPDNIRYYNPHAMGFTHA